MGWLALLALISLGLLACSSPNLKSAAQSVSPLPNATEPTVTPTYDGSGQATEPSLVFFSGSWHGFRYWMVVNPYPNSDASFENPSMLVSDDGTAWSVPPGLTNPIALPSAGHLADPSLLYDGGSDQLWLYYLQEDQAGIHVLRRTSSDGVNWSPADDLLVVPVYALLEPTVEKVGNGYAMWSVNAGSIFQGGGCSAPSTTVEYRTSSDGLHWSSPQTVSLTQPGFRVWHISVHVGTSGESPAYSMLFSGFQQNCGSTSLFYATSPDGMNWTTFGKSILSPQQGNWDGGQIYDSTFLHQADTDTLRIWYAGRGSAGWHIGYTQGRLATIIQWLQQ